MQDTRGNWIIKWMVAIGDWIMACCLLPAFSRVFPQYTAKSLLRDTTQSDYMLLLLSIVIATYIVPTVVHQRKINVDDIVRRNTILVIITMAIFVTACRVVNYSGNNIVFGTTFGIVLWICIMLSRLVERYVINYFRGRGRNTRSVVFVGSDPANLSVYNELMADPTTGYRVVGYYSNAEIEGAPASFKKLGDRADLQDLMDHYDDEDQKVSAEELYCSLSHDEKDYIRDIMDFCNKHVIRFYYVPRILGNIQLSLRPEMMGGSVVYTNYHEPLLLLSNRVIKRTFDIVVSAAILLCLIPFLPIVALCIKLQSKGPIFFKQERTGLNGNTFMCYKFRSMHVNKDADRVQATKNDPRKFAFGEFMRKTNIDEFPQFYNVLKGDMSIVGPRPHMVYHTEKYSALIDKYMVRHFSKPGVTGWAQVTGFRGETEELWQMEGRIQKDIWYIENWSLWLDIKIIMMTALSIVRPDKAAY